MLDQEEVLSHESYIFITEYFHNLISHDMILSLCIFTPVKSFPPWFYRSKSCFLQAMAESSESLTLTLTLTPFKCVEWNGERNVCSVLVWEPDKSFSPHAWKSHSFKSNTSKRDDLVSHPKIFTFCHKIDHAKLECCCGWLSWHCCAVSRVVARWLLTGSKQKIPPSTPNYGSGVSFVWWIFLLLYNQPKSNHLKVTFALANTINNAIS